MKIKILGNTIWGSTLSFLLSNAGNEVDLIFRNNDKLIESKNSSKFSIGNKELDKPNNIKFINFEELHFEENDLFLIALPSSKIKKNLQQIKNKINNKITVISASKGLSEDGKTLTEMIASETEIDSSQIGVITGPNLATEILEGKPATTLLSFSDLNKANSIRDDFSSKNFRVYSGNDVVGAEIGGALKNIIAIGSGIIDRLQLGDNAKSAFITRGLREITRFGTYHGAKEYTFYGLSGIGDLFTTCSSNLSRNWQLGYSLASGMTYEEFKTNKKITVEGANATKIVNMISQKKDIDMPITNMTYKVLEEKYDPEIAIKEFMGRDLSQERN